MDAAGLSLAFDAFVAGMVLRESDYDACFERVRKALANPGIPALEIQGGTEKLRQELLAPVSSDPFQGF
jgi:Kef-type K+ transport system membrane component KefB